MTKFWAAPLLSKLKTLPREVKIGHSKGEYLADKLRKAEGVDPLEKDFGGAKRVHNCFAMRYDPDELDGRQSWPASLASTYPPSREGNPRSHCGKYGERQGEHRSTARIVDSR